MGSTVKKSVEEVWRELNAAKPAPRNAISGIAGVASRPRTVGGAGGGAEPKAAVPAPASIPVSSLESVPVAATANGAPREGHAAIIMQHYDPAKAGTADEVQAYVASIQRTVNCLTDPDRSLRRSASMALHAKLFTGDVATPRASPQLLQALLCGPLLHPLLTMLSDSVERCRATALSILLEGGRQAPDVAPLLPALLPALVRRYGQLPVQEPAEEIRLQIVDLVALVVSRAEPKVCPWAGASHAVCGQGIGFALPCQAVLGAGMRPCHAAAGAWPHDPHYTMPMPMWVPCLHAAC